MDAEPSKASKLRQKKKKTKVFRKDARKYEEAEIKQLTDRIEAEKPEKGTNPLANEFKEDSYEPKYPEAKSFDQLPISTATKTALTAAKFTNMTDIQRASIPHALAGRDILGAAKTGSGKTLAFLVPVIEVLYRSRWTPVDGLGALIISPTRELALQIFETLQLVGRHHSFSAGLIIGGKDLRSEQAHIHKMNILVATPGRLLQHMDQTPSFDCSNLRILVLDEADRILDMGFAKTLNAIVENLPPERQTLLFSATQTKSVRDLARLSLQEPEYVAVHARDTAVTPEKLIQNYMVVELPQKLQLLWSFIRSHLKNKCIVFFSSCKQVRYVHELFRRMRPGVPLTAIHGKVKQMKRYAIFSEFCAAKAAVMFATDLAARGLDFPLVDWVVQYDCPEDVATYIHRAGRTARFESRGRGLLFLLPQEQKMAELLTAARIPLEEIKSNPSKLVQVQGTVDGMVAADPELKYLAQKAFMSYLRSVFLQKNKEVFDVNALPTEEYARSLGLMLTPKISFTKSKKSDKNAPRAALSVDDGDESSSVGAPAPGRTSVERLMSRKSAVLERSEKLRASESESEDEDQLLVVKRRNHDLPTPAPAAPSSKKAVAPISEAEQADRQKYLEKVSRQLREADVDDKAQQKARRKEHKLSLKLAARAERQSASGGGVQLAVPDEEEYEESEGSAQENGYDEDNNSQDGSREAEEEFEEEMESAEEDEEEAPAPPPSKAKGKRPSAPAQPISLEEQEELALAVLKKRKMSSSTHKYCT